MTTAVVVGDTAPDFVFTTAQGDQRHMAALWKDAPVLALWLRHFG